MAAAHAPACAAAPGVPADVCRFASEICHSLEETTIANRKRLLWGPMLMSTRVLRQSLCVRHEMGAIGDCEAERADRRQSRSTRQAGMVKRVERNHNPRRQKCGRHV